MKTIYQSVEHRIEHATGEVKETVSNSIVQLPPEPPYYKRYIHDLCALKDIPKALDDTLEALLTKLDYDGYITLSSRFRDKICTSLKITRGTLRNRISELVKTELILKEPNSKNEYLVNPSFFARGAWRDIYEQKKDFEMKIRYKSNGTREITTSAVNSTQLSLIK